MPAIFMSRISVNDISPGQRETKEWKTRKIIDQSKVLQAAPSMPDLVRIAEDDLKTLFEPDYLALPIYSEDNYPVLNELIEVALKENRQIYMLEWKHNAPYAPGREKPR